MLKPKQDTTTLLNSHFVDILAFYKCLDFGRSYYNLINKQEHCQYKSCVYIFATAFHVRWRNWMFSSYGNVQPELYTTNFIYTTILLQKNARSLFWKIWPVLEKGKQECSAFPDQFCKLLELKLLFSQRNTIVEPVYTPSKKGRFSKQERNDYIYLVIYDNLILLWLIFGIYYTP